MAQAVALRHRRAQIEQAARDAKWDAMMAEKQAKWDAMTEEERRNAEMEENDVAARRERSAPGWLGMLPILGLMALGGGMPSMGGGRSSRAYRGGYRGAARKGWS